MHVPCPRCVACASSTPLRVLRAYRPRSEASIVVRSCVRPQASKPIRSVVSQSVREGPAVLPTSSLHITGRAQRSLTHSPPPRPGSMGVFTSSAAEEKRMGGRWT